MLLLRYTNVTINVFPTLTAGTIYYRVELSVHSSLKSNVLLTHYLFMRVDNRSRSAK